jgi:hypothetical protein
VACRSAIAKAFKAGRDSGVENDPLAQAEAALQVPRAPTSHRPHSHALQTIGAGDLPYEKGSYDYRGRAKKQGKAV